MCVPNKQSAVDSGTMCDGTEDESFSVCSYDEVEDLSFRTLDSLEHHHATLPATSAERNHSTSWMMTGIPSQGLCEYEDNSSGRSVTSTFSRVTTSELSLIAEIEEVEDEDDEWDFTSIVASRGRSSALYCDTFSTSSNMGFVSPNRQAGSNCIAAGEICLPFTSPQSIINHDRIQPQFPASNNNRKAGDIEKSTAPFKSTMAEDKPLKPYSSVTHKGSGESIKRATASQPGPTEEEISIAELALEQI